MTATSAAVPKSRPRVALFVWPALLALAATIGEAWAQAQGATEARPPVAEAALRAVEQLGLATGQALACGDQGTVTRARQLMLRHAPRTATFGATFEQSTQSGFMSHVKGSSPCPSTQAQSARVDAIELTLRATLPAGE